MLEPTFNTLEISCIFLLKSFTSPAILYPRHCTALKMAKRLIPLTDGALHHGGAFATPPAASLFLQLLTEAKLQGVQDATSTTSQSFSPKSSQFTKKGEDSTMYL